MHAILAIILMGILAMAVALFFAIKVSKAPTFPANASPVEQTRLTDIASAISEGAMAFLTREAIYMSVFIVVFGVLVNFLVDSFSALSFLVGSVISVVAGFVGMKAATMGNVRTTAAAQQSIRSSFRMAFDTGAVMGFALVGMALLGLIGMYLLLQVLLPYGDNLHLMEALAGFGLGGSSIALFARVGGGIYTKAADVGADLVGKVEENIPEDDPRNPAVIADNVGDNVGDIAGMGADLFGSIAESTCAALVIGAVAFSMSEIALLYPLLITAIGIPIALVTLLLASVRDESDIESTLKRCLVVSTILMAGALYWLTHWALPTNFIIQNQAYTATDMFWCVFSGLVSGLLIGISTEYYTSHRFRPVQEVAESSETGPATNIIYGLSLGYKSSLIPVIVLAITVYIGYAFGGMYGIAVASLGMLGTIAISLTIDAFGPVADNAGGIAEMAELGDAVRKRTDALDSAGNTTAAVGKGFAIGSAALTSLALFSAFLVRADVGVLNILEPAVLSFMLFGAVLPFIFTAMTLKSVGKAAMDMITEVRRQFATIPGLRPGIALNQADFEKATAAGIAVSMLKDSLVGKNFAAEDDLKTALAAISGAPSFDALQPYLTKGGDVRPDYRRCVDISTKASLREMILPGAQVIFTPIVVGYLFGAEALAGMLLGSLATGIVLAIASANAGGGWDNAKKYIEAGALGGKGSAVHSAAVVGDTVGDPFKDTSGPSLNILVKLQAIISLVFAPFFMQGLHLLG